MTCIQICYKNRFLINMKIQYFQTVSKSNPMRLYAVFYRYGLEICGMTDIGILRCGKVNKILSF